MVLVSKLGCPQANQHGVLLMGLCSTGVLAWSLIGSGGSIVLVAGSGYP